MSDYRSILQILKETTPFQILVKTDNAGVTGSNSILLPVRGNNMVVDWGDGTVQLLNQNSLPNNTIGGANISRTYATAGTYVIKIRGGLTGIRFNNGGDRLKLLDIQGWGRIIWASTGLTNGFFGCSNMNITADDNPILSSVTNLGNAFNGCTNLNANLNNWNVANVQFMNFMLTNCTNFNSPLNNWNVSNLTQAQQMFRFSGFNQPLSNWNVGNLDNMSEMFRDSPFNQNLSSWVLRSAGVNLSSLFRNSGMNTSNYTDTIVSWANQVFTNGTPLNVNMTSQQGRTYTTSRSGGANFANAGAARTFLTGATPPPTGAGWTISNDTVV